MHVFEFASQTYAKLFSCSLFVASLRIFFLFSSLITTELVKCYFSIFTGW